MRDIGRIGIIGGAGWLGRAITTALINSGTVPTGRLTCSFRSKKPENRPECAWTRDSQQLVENSDVVVLSVRPGDWSAIDIDAAGKLVISVMAGVRLDDIKHKTGSCRAARALPNAAAALGHSYTPIFVSSPEAGDEEITKALFRSCGLVDIVSQEQDIDYFTAMSGSGEAFPALLAEAMMNDAVARGIAPGIARRAAQQITIGAGRLQEHQHACPAETVKSFIDYDGTTTAAILAMRQMGFGEAVSAGLEAAFHKARTSKTA